MFKLFKKNSTGKSDLKFADMDGNPLHEGDKVLSLRYDLGECRITKSSSGYEYESIESGKKVHWLKMVDAHTKNQKVRKL